MSKSVLLKGVSPEVKKLAEEARKHFSSPEGQRELEEFFERIGREYQPERHCCDPFCPFCRTDHKPFVATI